MDTQKGSTSRERDSYQSVAELVPWQNYDRLMGKVLYEKFGSIMERKFAEYEESKRELKECIHKCYGDNKLATPKARAFLRPAESLNQQICDMKKLALDETEESSEECSIFKSLEPTPPKEGYFENVPVDPHTPIENGNNGPIATLSGSHSHTPATMDLGLKVQKFQKNSPQLRERAAVMEDDKQQKPYAHLGSQKPMLDTTIQKQKKIEQINIKVMGKAKQRDAILKDKAERAKRDNEERQQRVLQKYQQQAQERKEREEEFRKNEERLRQFRAQLTPSPARTLPKSSIIKKPLVPSPLPTQGSKIPVPIGPQLLQQQIPKTPMPLQRANKVPIQMKDIQIGSKKAMDQGTKANEKNVEMEAPLVKGNLRFKYQQKDQLAPVAQHFMVPMVTSTPKPTSSANKCILLTSTMEINLTPIGCSTTMPKTITLTDSSAYDMTTEKVFLPSTEEDYDVNDLSSRDETDEEDRPNKTVPNWATKENMVTFMVQVNKLLESDQVAKHFGKIEQPKIECFFPSSRKRYKPRTSSAVWNSPLSDPAPGIGRLDELLAVYN